MASVQIDPSTGLIQGVNTPGANVPIPSSAVQPANGSLGPNPFANVGMWGHVQPPTGADFLTWLSKQDPVVQQHFKTIAFLHSAAAAKIAAAQHPGVGFGLGAVNAGIQHAAAPSPIPAPQQQAPPIPQSAPVTSGGGGGVAGVAAAQQAAGGFGGIGDEYNQEYQSQVQQINGQYNQALNHLQAIHNSGAAAVKQIGALNQRQLAGLQSDASHVNAAANGQIGQINQQAQSGLQQQFQQGAGQLAAQGISSAPTLQAYQQATQSLTEQGANQRQLSARFGQLQNAMMTAQRATNGAITEGALGDLHNALLSGASAQEAAKTAAIGAAGTQLAKSMQALQLEQVKAQVAITTAQIHAAASASGGGSGSQLSASALGSALKLVQDAKGSVDPTSYFKLGMDSVHPNEQKLTAQVMQGLQAGGNPNDALKAWYAQPNGTARKNPSLTAGLIGYTSAWNNAQQLSSTTQGLLKLNGGVKGLPL